MEDIYSGVKKDKKVEIETLRSEGLNNIEIAEKLGVSKQYVGKILKSSTGNEGVPKVNQESKPKPSNADLNAVGNFITIEEQQVLLKEFKERMIEEFNKRLNYYIENKLDMAIRKVLRTLNIQGRDTKESRESISEQLRSSTEGKDSHSLDNVKEEHLL